MMQYKYRWLYALAVICCVIFWVYSCDLQMLFEQRGKLIKQEKHLLNRLQLFKSVSSPSTFVVSNKTLSSTELLAELIMLAHLNNVLLITAKYIKLKTVELVLQGSFSQLAIFVEKINYSDSMLVLAFSCRQLPINKMEMTMQVTMLPYSIPSLHLKKNNLLAMKNEGECLLSQMKMTGRLSQGKHQIALIALPTRRVIAVNLGSRIGKEQGVVQAIYHDRIIVEHNKKRVMIMK